MRSDKLLAYIAFGLVCFLWGTTYLAIAVAIETLPTFLFAGVRFTAAGAILLALCAWRGQKIPRELSQWVNAGIVGLLMVGLGNIAVIFAEHHVPSGFAALLVATSPFWMAILEYFRRNQAVMTTRRKIGMLIGFSGVVLLVSPALRTPADINFWFILGVLAIQVGSIAWNIGSIRSKYNPVDAPPLVAAAMQMLTGGAIVAIIGVLHGEIPQFSFTARTLTAFLYLMVFGSIVAYGAYVYALAHLPTSTVSLYAYVNPAVAVVLGWLILDERLGPIELIAMAIILGGVALVQSGPKPQPAPAAAEG